MQASLKAYSSGDVGINTLMVWHAEQIPRGSSLCAKPSFCLGSFLDPSDLPLQTTSTPARLWSHYPPQQEK